MALTTEQIKKISFSSQYGMDKILSIYEGSFSIAKAIDDFTKSEASKSTSHDVGGECFPVMIWSIDNSTWYPGGQGFLGSNGFATNTDQTVEVSCYVTATTLKVVANNWTTSSRTIYYKVALLGMD